jgi:hypothetical protein
MGMTALLCSLSSARRAMIEKEPDLVADLVRARSQGGIPGLLDLGKTWDALQQLLGDELGEAVVTSGGAKLGKTGYGPARIIEPDHVAKLATALDKLPKKLVEERHTAPGSEAQELAAKLNELIELYRRAAASGHAMLSIVV